MLRLLPSDPLFAELNFLLTVRAQWMNPACHFDLCEYPDVERRAFVAELDEALQETFEELTR